METDQTSSTPDFNVSTCLVDAWYLVSSGHSNTFPGWLLEGVGGSYVTANISERIEKYFINNSLQN